MADLMTNLAELVMEINRINPPLEDPLRHAKRECKRMAQTKLEHAVAEAWMALRAVGAMEDAQRDQAKESVMAETTSASPSKVIAWRVNSNTSKGGWIDGEPPENVLEDFGVNAPSAEIECAFAGPQTSQPAATEPKQAGASFQARVQPWMMACFGPAISADRIERNHRYLEESLELVQATGCTAKEAHQLVDYVFGRPVGEPAQEVGGAMVTLAALCLANGLDMHDAAEVELARIWTMIETIRAKQATKPRHSPLPAAPSVPGASERGLIAFREVINYVCGAGRHEEPLEFLRCWNEGNFSALRKEWPDAPPAIFYADPLADHAAIDAALAQS